MKAGEGNVTIEVRLDEGGKTGKLVIRGKDNFDQTPSRSLIHHRHGYRYEQGRAGPEPGYNR